MSSDRLDFRVRAELSEWMDEPCSYEEFHGCLRDLAQVNRWTLSYRPTMRWLRQFAGAQRMLHIVDIGCGGGDTLRTVERWAAGAGLGVRLTGIDLNPHAARAARSMTPPSSRIEWVTGDAFSSGAAQGADLILSSLVTHHLPDGEIIRFLRWMEETATLGWFVNDLHRARIPYHLFRLLAWAARWHRFVRHDGPVSIRRAFSVQDWERLTAAAGLDAASFSIEPRFPARLCVSRVKRLA